MRVLFDGEPNVHYAQIYLDSRGEAAPLLDKAFAGQANGLCGATVPGALFMITGLHTGQVHFRVERHDEPPGLDESWGEIVEASFSPASSVTSLVEWAGEAHWPFALGEASLRARYCARRMDAGRALDTALEGELAPDRYLLQLWPAPPAPDLVVKQTSEIAAYWHDFARRLPPPPSPEDVAAAQRRADLERERQLDQHWVNLYWGGRPPSERLGSVGGNVLGVVALDRALVEAIAGADPTLQRSIARWAARRAYTGAGIADVGWARAGLDALERGEDLPPPFDDPTAAFELLRGDGRVPSTVVTHPEGGPANVSQQHAALPALWGAGHADPLRAAVDAIHAAAVTVGDDYPILFEEIRRSFPAIAGH